MDCLQTRQFIDAPARGETPPAEFQTHLDTCELCRERYGATLLEAELLIADSPEPRAGFVDEAIGNAIAAGEHRRAWPLAAAATIAVLGIALGILFGTMESGVDSAPVMQVALEPYEGKLVRVVINSTVQRDDATFTIELAENLQLDGYPNMHLVSFNTALRRGKNLLELPLTLTDTSDSHFEVGLRYGSTHNQLRVQVNALEPQTTEISL